MNNQPYQTYYGQSNFPQNGQPAQTPMQPGQVSTIGTQHYLTPQMQTTSTGTTSTTTTTTTSHQTLSNSQQYSQPQAYANQLNGWSNSQYSTQATMPAYQQPQGHLNQQQNLISNTQYSTPAPLPAYQHPQEWGNQQTVTSNTQYSTHTAMPAYQQQQALPQPPSRPNSTVHQKQQQQTSYTAQQQPPAQQPAPNFAQFMQAPPKPQQPPVLMHPPPTAKQPSVLMQPAKQPPVLIQQPPTPKQAPLKIDTKANTSTTVTTIETTRTERYKGEHAGGEARKEAEAKGEEQVKIFEKKVQKILQSLGPCPLMHGWYNLGKGYLCGGGNHLVYHKDIDMAINQPGWIPEVTIVNSAHDPESDISGILVAVHPPPIDFWQPMHRVHQRFMEEVAPFCGAVSKEDLDSGKVECPKACYRNVPRVSKREALSNLTAAGYNPLAGRHSFFREMNRRSS